MWQELGIEPTADAKAIRSAYARRLKTLDPDRDPAAFQRLRQAYEAALANAPTTKGRGHHPPDTARLATPGPTLPDPAPLSVALRSSEPLPPPPSQPGDGGQAARELALQLDRAAREARPVLDALNRALRDRDARQALELVDQAMAGGVLPLTPDGRLVERLAEVVAEDRTLPAETSERLIRGFGWDAHANARRSAAVARAVGRLEAAAWYARLVADAQQRRFGPRDAERNIARMMLGQNRLLPLVAGPFWKRHLRTELAQYDRHRRWLEGRFDAQRIEWLRSRTRQRPGGGKRWYLVLMSIVVISNLLRACPDIYHRWSP